MLTAPPDPERAEASGTDGAASRDTPTPAEEPTVPCWRVPDSDDLVWAHWDADSSLYHRGTGETHLLDAFSSEVVQALCDGPLTLAQLSRLLADRCDTEDDPAWRQKIARILGQLRALHIIEKHPWPDSPTSQGRN